MTAAIAAEFILLAALWGASFLFLRAGAMAFGPLPTALLRVGIAVLVLLPLVAWGGQWRVLRRHAGPILMAGLLNSGLPFALFGFAVLHISTGLSSILNATTPLWGALVAWLWLGDRPGTSRLVGLVIGFVGVGLLSWLQAGFSSSASALAVAACLGATLCYGIAGSYTKRYLTGVHPMATAAGSQVGASLALAGPALVQMPPLTGPQAPPTTAWVAVLCLGLLCTALAYVLYFRLIERAGPARALTVTFLIPVFAIAYGVMFLGEQLTGSMLACGALVVAGTALATGVWPVGRSSTR